MTVQVVRGGGALMTILGLLLASDSNGQGPGRPMAGWPDILISRTGYDLRFEKPVVAAGEKPEAYQQKAIYDWTGGRIDTLELTLLRDPGVKSKYSADAMKKEKDVPTGKVINGKQAWHWIADPTAPRRDGFTSRLIVVLSDDKAMIMEQKYHTEDLPALAAKFDFGKIEKALVNPPKR